MKCLLKLALILGISAVASFGSCDLSAETLSFTAPNVTTPGAILAVGWRRPTWLNNYADIRLDNLGDWQANLFYDPTTGRVRWWLAPIPPIGQPQPPPPLTISNLVGRYSGPIFHLHKGDYSDDGSFDFVALKNGTYLLKIEIEGQSYYAQGKILADGLSIVSLSTVLQRPKRASLGLQLYFARHPNNSVTCEGILSNGLGFLQLSGQHSR